MKKITLAFFTLLFLFYLASGQSKVLHNFNNSGGAFPQGSLALSGSVLYGMTLNGGANSAGCIFSMDTNGGRYKDIFDFNNTYGASPYGNVIISGKVLYGMTSGGGVYSHGCIFSIDTDGSRFKVLHNFNDTNGDAPVGDLTLVGNRLYGMASGGGLYNGGILFSIDTIGGGFTVLHNFDTASGIYPQGSLTRSGNTLYGMTEAGGTHDSGTVFSININGSRYIDLYNLKNTYGALPYGSLVLSDSMLYGMTWKGGTYNHGVIFSLDTNGNRYSDMHDFSTGDGYYPKGTLTIYRNVLYGMTSFGGAGDYGIMFAINPNGSKYIHLFDFNTINSAYPYQGFLTPSGNTLFGMASSGGKGFGVIFNYALISVTISGTNVSCNGDGNGYATAYATGGTGPYTYKWSPGGATSDNITKLSTGTYTITVTDKNGFVATASVVITQPTAINATIYSTPDNGNNTGTAAVHASGGTSPYTYLWNPGGNTTDSIANKSAGSYCCTITDANGCVDSTCITINSDAGLGAVPENKGQISIDPNPNNGNFTITFSHPVSLQARSGSQTIEVYNIIGERIYNAMLNQVQHDYEINLSSQPNGIYLYRVITEIGNLIGEGKLIIQK